jgi:hypothetical protein
MEDEDIYYREFTVEEDQNFENFMNSRSLMQYMYKFPDLIVGNYYVIKFKDNYDDPNEEFIIMVVGYFLGIDNRPNRIPSLIFSINEGVTLEDYFSMHTHRARIENGIYQAGISMEDEFFDMTSYLNTLRRNRLRSMIRPVTQRHLARTRYPEIRQTGSRGRSPAIRRTNSRGRSPAIRRTNSRGRSPAIRRTNSRGRFSSRGRIRH